MIKNQTKNIQALILAAGRGTRLNNGQPSEKPKVSYEICGKPMILYTLENLQKAGIDNIIVVLGYKKEEVKKILPNYIKIAIQKEQKGTGHAVLSAKPQVNENIKFLLVLNGDDTAFLKPKTIQKLISYHLKHKNTITFISVIRKNPSGFGRIKRNKKGNIIGIVEEKEANSKEKQIKETNTGIYVFEKNWLFENLPKITKSTSGEYYLTDIISLAIQNKEKIAAIVEKDEKQFIGINTPEQLKYANKIMEKILKNK